MKTNVMFLKVLAKWRRSKKIVSEELTTYDPAEDLTSDEAIETFMAEAFKTKDAGFIAYADGIVARARAKNMPADGILAHAKDMMKALGIKLRVEGLYGRRLRPYLGLIASVAVVVVAGGGGAHLYLKNANTPTHGGVVSRDIQGSSITHTASGDIHISIPLEQYEADLKEREQEVTERLKQAYAEERAVLEKEKVEIEHRLIYVKNLEERINQLEVIRGQVPDALLDRARAALIQGDWSEAERLLAQFEEQDIKASVR